MTPEKAEYFRLMLMVGQYDEFDAELDRILEQEDPITEPALSIALCMSDRKRTIEALADYLRDRPADDAQVCDMVVAYVRDRYASGTLTRRQAADLLAEIVGIAGNRMPELWEQLLYPDICCEYYEDYLITEKTYEECFDGWMLWGEEAEFWEVQQENRKKPTAYWVNLGFVIALCVLSFAAIFITVYLTGGRELGEFTSHDRKVFAGFVLCELAIVTMELYFAARCAGTLRQKRRTAP